MKNYLNYSIILSMISFLLLVAVQPIDAAIDPIFTSQHVNLLTYFFNIESENLTNIFQAVFISLLGLGMFGIAFSFVNVGSKRIKKHNDYLENLVKDRTRTLEEKHQQLRAQNEAYKEALELIHDQKEEIETAQQDLLVKNRDLREAFEEIQSQNELLDHERSKLEQAKRIIQGQNKKLMGIARNLDQQVQERTKELSVSNNLLLEKNKELDEFIYKSAHDLRGPIARFKGLSQLIQMEYDQDNDISDHLRHLNHSANHMDNMLKRLSNVYEISARPISPQMIDVNMIMETVFERLKGEENMNNVSIEVNNLVKDKVQIDPSLLHLILKNLIGNAVRFYDPLKLKKWVKVNIEIVDKQLVVSVKDNGIGIKKEQQENIFDLFYVGSELPKGPGLGLYICKIITKKLNGDISLNYSSKEKETEFKTSIPIGL
ncbi:sensor histidine kinase [Marivirga tractuosa]|uniref:histidine kinase n=1 Tax=Marivirga tractuosa (strain ATCC 23168 / DSM 4126 / NBRC 15989 / NCIMB 1408 / VKM B-1430 / H-43) TaxID=643867 RepID=E4TNE3_MARTH|nr:HAMP domain-containing sensor histidine kinase [Marivirga tractuosa]ADR20400.1 integral membrane sensor signal transduction histidine kinase [Marivirga tractuosa DSM 4126]